MMNSRTFMVFGLVMAGICLIRVLSVAAAPRPNDEVEVYSATEGGSEDDSRSSEQERNEIQLTRPDEAAGRIADEQGYDMVPGVDRLNKRSAEEGTLIVPKKVGRSIASSNTLPESPIEPRTDAAASPQPTRGDLRAGALAPEAMEPKPLSSADVRGRAADLRSEAIVASNQAPGRAALGIRSEPAPETRIDPPMPSSVSAARAGTQEISLIVSDYGYFPSRIFVTQNVPVKIYLTTPSKVTMCFMLDNMGLRKGISPGRVEELTFVPDSPGEYRFYCPVKSIEGTLTVREAPSATPSGRNVASDDTKKEEDEPPTAGVGNAPKRAAQLRSLIED